MDNESEEEATLVHTKKRKDHSNILLLLLQRNCNARICIMEPLAPLLPSPVRHCRT
jgi:hypothetical protein